jgi:hypothetical protein
MGDINLIEFAKSFQDLNHFFSGINKTIRLRMTTFSFGRNPKNDIRIDRSDISDFHARITRLEDGGFLVEDLDSSNGTFINGYRIRKATVGEKDEVRLSFSFPVDLAGIFGLDPGQNEPKKDPMDFTSEFQALRKVYEDYQQERIRIIRKHNLRTSIVRGIFTFAPLVIYEVIILSGALKGSVGEFAKNYIVFSVLGSTVAVLATTNLSPVKKLGELEEDFRVRYICPNPECQAQLGNVPWKSYAQQRKCYRCGAVYVHKHDNKS